MAAEDPTPGMSMVATSSGIELICTPSVKKALEETGLTSLEKCSNVSRERERVDRERRCHQNWSDIYLCGCVVVEGRERKNP